MRAGPTLAVCLTLLAAPAVMAAPAGRSAAQAVADPSRPPDQVAADALRLPAATLAFAGVRPGMAIGEFYPGGGYFTRLLSDMTGPTGHIYAIENTGWHDAVTADQALAGLGNVSVAALPFGTVRFPVPLDLAWITQNYHDLKIAKYGQVDTLAFDRAVFAALKPGGIFLVLDHQAPPHMPVAAIATLHRIDHDVVVREVTAAGFRLAGEGNFLHRATDDHTLPIFDPKVRGRTDQFVLRFVKPS